MTDTDAQTSYQLTLCETDDAARRELLHTRIRQFNDSTSPHHQQVRQAGSIRPLCVYLQAPDGELVGGLTSNTYWDWWEVDYFWVREDLRGQGFGRRIMLLAEDEARGRGCRHAQLTTFSFQAPAFYAMVGYRVVGQLDDYPPGATYYWLRKDLV